jgi:hypothetical protein
MAICFETRYRNDDIGVQWEKLPHDVKAVVDYARRQPGIRHVILLGHSGGSPMMSLYQAIAEKDSLEVATYQLVEVGRPEVGLVPVKRRGRKPGRKAKPKNGRRRGAKKKAAASPPATEAKPKRARKEKKS